MNVKIMEMINMFNNRMMGEARKETMGTVLQKIFVEGNSIYIWSGILQYSFEYIVGGNLGFEYGNANKRSTIVDVFTTLYSFPSYYK